jgi:hypothetical protein
LSSQQSSWWKHQILIKMSCALSSAKSCNSLFLSLSSAVAKKKIQLVFSVILTHPCGRPTEKSTTSHDDRRRCI